MGTLGKQLSFYSLVIIGESLLVINMDCCPVHDVMVSATGCIMLLGWIQGKNLLEMFTIGVRYVS